MGWLFMAKYNGTQFTDHVPYCNDVRAQKSKPFHVDALTNSLKYSDKFIQLTFGIKHQINISLDVIIFQSLLFLRTTLLIYPL